MNTLENLKNLIGENFDDVTDDIICAFVEEGEVVIKNSENSGYDKIAYIDAEDSRQYLFTLENRKIVDVWEA